MNKGWYISVGWVLAVIGVISAIFLLWEGTIGNVVEIGGGPEPIFSIIISFAIRFFLLFLILALFLVPAIFYIRIKQENINKLTNWSIGLTLTGLISFILIILFLLVVCSINPSSGVNAFGNCFAWSMYFFGLFALISVGILYGIAILLLIINWFKNRN